MASDILFSKACTPEYKKGVQACLKKSTCKKIDTLGRIFCASGFEENPFDLVDSAKTYIISENLDDHLESIQNSPTREGIRIFTFSADCSLIYGGNLSHKLSEFLETKAFLSDCQAKSYQLVMQEALVNAIEYGCLEMSGVKQTTIDENSWFEKYRSIITERLTQAKYATRKVKICCYLHANHIVTYIEDEGNGFSEKEVDASDKPAIQAYGMGRTIIAGLADKHHYENNGKTLVVEFKAPFIQTNLDIGTGETTLKEIRKNSKVLIVDDQKSNREFAKIYLKSAGYANIIEAENGEQAIELSLSEMPDIIILDIIMPGIDGFTACRKIKMNKETHHIPILFLSGLDDPESKVQGYRIGAVDYVSKPIDRIELIARTDTHIQSGRMNRSLSEYSSRTKKDLLRASRIQERLLPSETDLDIMRHKHDLGIEYTYQACDELAGDYWSVMDISNDEIGIALADFTGHGVVASLNTIRMHALFQEFADLWHDPIKFTEALNDKLYNQLEVETFATFCYCVLNTRTGAMKYVGCGAPSIAVIPKEGKGFATMLDCSGLPLGLVPSSGLMLEDRCAIVTEGDSLLFYSDALIETPHKGTGEIWEESGLVRELEDIRAVHLMPTLEDLVSKFNDMAAQPLKDDLTMLLLTRAIAQSEETIMEKLTNTVS